MRHGYATLIATLALSTSLIAHDKQWEACKETVLEGLPHIQGWCRPEKATHMMDLIYKEHPKVCVEVGVFGGSSIYPTAQALKYLGEEGVVYAIDSWRNSDSLQGTTPGDANYQWWKKLNLEEIYNGFISMLDWYSLRNQCQVLRMTSEEAVTKFADNSIDILHIDGNHHEGLRDAKLWLPKVKPGGHIWFDDANWHETADAIAYLNEVCLPGKLVEINGAAWQIFTKKKEEVAVTTLDGLTSHINKGNI